MRIVKCFNFATKTFVVAKYLQMWKQSFTMSVSFLTYPFIQLTDCMLNKWCFLCDVITGVWVKWTDNLHTICQLLQFNQFQTTFDQINQVALNYALIVVAEVSFLVLSNLQQVLLSLVHSVITLFLKKKKKKKIWKFLHQVCKIKLQMCWKCLLTKYK